MGEDVARFVEADSVLPVVGGFYPECLAGTIGKAEIA